MNYNILKNILFNFEPEFSHNFTLKAIKGLEQISLLQRLVKDTPNLSKNVFGLTFPNPVGLAAGLDKNGDYIDALAALGFGFIEIGTVTPKPQAGNPKPRMFRLVKDQAIINRMGFNNKGVDYLVQRVKERKYQGILGINIGKNATTEIKNAIDDYRFCLKKVYQHASYITINISSPNTVGLRDLQGAEYLSSLVADLKKEQEQLADIHRKYVPMLIKVAPDLSTEEIKMMSHVFIAHKVDGVIATNTTLDRSKLTEERYLKEAGGLSGDPLFEKATDVLIKFKQELATYQIPLIASGGIISAEQASQKIKAGADLLQLYTGLIYQGPDLIFACCERLQQTL